MVLMYKDFDIILNTMWSKKENYLNAITKAINSLYKSLYKFHCIIYYNSCYRIMLKKSN